MKALATIQLQGSRVATLVLPVIASLFQVPSIETTILSWAGSLQRLRRAETTVWAEWRAE